MCGTSALTFLVLTANMTKFARRDLMNFPFYESIFTNVHPSVADNNVVA